MEKSLPYNFHTKFKNCFADSYHKFVFYLAHLKLSGHVKLIKKCIS